MLRKLQLLFLSVSLTAFYGFSQVGLGTVKGTVTDGDSKSPISFCKVMLLQGGSIRGGATTDAKGQFQINSVAAGT